MGWNKSYQFLCGNCTFFVSGNCEITLRKAKKDDIACKKYEE